MQIRVGYELIYDCPQPTPMILTLNIHFTRVSDILVPDHLITHPSIPITAYRDAFGNWCSRIVAPKGQIRLSTDAVVNDSGEVDIVVPTAPQIPVQDLPNETLVFLLGSRYCETDRLSQTAWDLFGQSPTGWARVQAICDYVNRHISFGYEHARSTKTAWDAFQIGVEKATNLPSLQTVRAVFPHTAFQSRISSSGLTNHSMSFFHSEKSMLGEIRIWHKLM